MPGPGNGEHVEIQKQLGAINTQVARVEGKLDVLTERLSSLPCGERGKTIEALDVRLKCVEDNVNYVRGAAGAAKYIWGYVLAGLLAIAAFVLQVIRPR